MTQMLSAIRPHGEEVDGREMRREGGTTGVEKRLWESKSGERDMRAGGVV